MGQAMMDRIRIDNTRAEGQDCSGCALFGYSGYSTVSVRRAETPNDLEGDEISSFGDFLTTVPSYTQIKEPLRRMCHRLIAFTIAGRGQAPEKVTTTDLYYLRSMEERTLNFPYLVAHYLFRYAEGRKQGAKMFGGHFIARLAEHFGLITEESL
ncbi:hypothetical protein Tco_1026161 [Tanacetum coccineum]